MTPISESQLAQGIAPGITGTSKLTTMKSTPKIPTSFRLMHFGRESRKYKRGNCSNPSWMDIRIFFDSGQVLLICQTSSTILLNEMGILLWSEFGFVDDLHSFAEAFMDNVLQDVNYQVKKGQPYGVPFGVVVSYQFFGSSAYNIHNPRVLRL